MTNEAAAGIVLVAVAACAAAGCMRTYEVETVEVAQATAQQPLRSATNLPSGFTVVRGPGVDGGCPVSLRDAGLRADLSLVRAVSIPQTDSAGVSYLWYGDYAVTPVGAYGEIAGEGLRVDCARMRPLGVVRLNDG